MTDPLRSEKDLHVVQVSLQELEEVLMRIVGGLDIPRQQITFDWVDLDTGEARRGRITPADRVGFRKWLGQFDGEVDEGARDVIRAGSAGRPSATSLPTAFRPTTSK